MILWRLGDWRARGSLQRPRNSWEGFDGRSAHFEYFVDLNLNCVMILSARLPLFAFGGIARLGAHVTCTEQEKSVPSLQTSLDAQQRQYGDVTAAGGLSSEAMNSA